MANKKNQSLIHLVSRCKIALKKKRWTKLRAAHLNKQRKVNMGIWRLKQTILYIQFLKSSLNRKENIPPNTKICVYQQMAAFVKSRSTLQCRSHHQKMLKGHTGIEQIIHYYSSLVIPRFQAEQIRLKSQREQRKQKKKIPFYIITTDKNAFRIEIQQNKIESY